jgi:TM2 domain-containing membrane protein YozV
MNPLTNDIVTKIDRVCIRHIIWGMLKCIYVFGIICMCAYSKYNNSYGLFYERIVSLLLTANVIWVLVDLIYNPGKEIIEIIRERR